MTVICLDPGHGGSDSGAVGTSGILEKDLNLAVAQHAQAALQRLGYQVVLTRSADTQVSLSERVRFAQQAKAAALVSIHHNAAPDPQAHGTEAYYCPGDPVGARLAQAVYDRMIARLGTAPRGVKASRLYVPCGGAQVHIPSCLVEVAFVSHPEEAAKAASSTFQALAGQAIAEGVDRFFAGASP